MVDDSPEIIVDNAEVTEKEEDDYVVEEREPEPEHGMNDAVPDVSELIVKHI